MTQVEFLSNPEICTKEVLQQVLEAARKHNYGVKLLTYTLYPDVESLILALSVEPPKIRFSEFAEDWSGKSNLDFLMICVQQLLGSTNTLTGKLEAAIARTQAAQNERAEQQEKIIEEMQQRFQKLELKVFGRSTNKGVEL